MAAGCARPSWPFSNSARTRARAAACAAAFSASASFLSAARRAFWRLMSFFCVTGAGGGAGISTRIEYRISNTEVDGEGGAHGGLCICILCRRGGLRCRRRGRGRAASRGRRRRSGAWTRFLAVATRTASRMRSVSNRRRLDGRAEGQGQGGTGPRRGRAEGRDAHAFCAIVEFLVFCVGEDGGRGVVLAVFRHGRVSLWGRTGAYWCSTGAVVQEGRGRRCHVGRRGTGL